MERSPEEPIFSDLDNDRAAYIARSIDMLGTMAGPEPAQKAARHYTTSAARAVLGVMRPRMRLSFLSDCDHVALPPLKLDPDTEMAHVLADIEVRQRGVSSRC